MAYLVLARKYRPQTFDDLVGQDHIAKTLTNALAAKRLAHAYVFSGPRGCGKTTSARILAKSLNCAQGPTATPCGTCPQCRDIAGGTSTDDVLEIDGASNRGIDQIRELRDTVKYAPARSRYRVIIIDEAHQISKDGFNALLKTLEEPPPHVVFMMATTEAQKIPETILSRCQRFQVRAISPMDIFTRIKRIIATESLAMEDATLHEVARAARGSLRDALSLLDQVIAFAPGGATAEDVRNLLGLLPKEFVRGFAATLRQGSASDILRAVQKALEDGFDLSQLAEDLLERNHSLLLWKAGVRTVSSDQAEFDAEVQGLSEESLERSVAIFSRAVADLRRSESPRVTFELACLEAAQDLVSVKELVDRLEALEKRLPAGPRPEDRPAPTAARATLAAPPTPAVPASEPPPPPPPAVMGTDPSVLKSAWARLTADIGRAKPSIESLLAAARYAWAGPGVLTVECDNDFQRGQLAAHERLWTDILRKDLGPVTVRLGVAPAPPASPVPPSLRPAAPAPIDDEAEVVDDSGEASAETGPVVEGPEEDARETAVQDPGLRKILDKFPGKIRRVDTHP